ncbi:MAG: hypothetical protein RIS84_806, partial [Pseudomonadota bacterium]
FGETGENFLQAFWKGKISHANAATGDISRITSLHGNHPKPRDPRSGVDADNPCHEGKLAELCKHFFADVGIGMHFLHVVQIFEHILQTQHFLRVV